MDIVNIIGSTAGVISSITFLPQVLKTYKSKSAKDISLPMFLLLLVGVALWLTYGILLHAVPIIVTNAIVLVLSFIMIGLKLKYGNQ